MAAPEEDLKVLQMKHTEAEEAIVDCNAALELIPTWALEKGQTWVPSDVALYLIKKAKKSAAAYLAAHTDNGR